MEDIGERGDLQTGPAKPTSTLMPGDQGVVLVRFASSKVAHTVAVARLTAAVVLGGLFLLWQVRAFISWFAIAFTFKKDRIRNRRFR
jgi:hypothetical protein